MAPFITRCTLPVFFSSTRISLVPMNAMVVGRFSPLTTGRTPNCGCSITGPLDCAEAVELMMRESTITAMPTLVQNPFLDISVYSFPIFRNELICLIENQGNLTVAELLLGSSEWLKFRPEC